MKSNNQKICNEIWMKKNLVPKKLMNAKRAQRDFMKRSNKITWNSKNGKRNSLIKRKIGRYIKFISFLRI